MANSNGWGDGSANNAIGWGQGANNNISWGKSQITSYSGATDIDGGNTPVNTVAPAITGTAQEGQTLTCSTGTWSGSPSYTYQWKRNGSNIGSATNSTYTLVTADVGQSIKCTVTATNFIGSASADSNTVTPTSSTDADAQAFITAAAITDPTQQAAINTLVVDLKGYNVWSKLIALYPFIGGSASSHSYNLKNISVGQLTYSSGVSHGVLGIKGNTTSFANTGLRSSTMGIGQNDASAGIYLQSLTNNQTMFFGHFGNFTMYWGHPAIYTMVNNSLGPATPITTFDGFFQESRINSSQMLYKGKNNSVLTIPGGTSALNSTLDWYICYANGYNGIQDWVSLHYISKGFSSTELDNFYTAVQTYQTTLNRQK
jgi:hypothetical protein